MSPALVSKAYEEGPAAQIDVDRSCPGSTGAAKRTARRRNRPAGATEVSTAHDVNAIVHSPCAMIPGKPAARATSSSRWIGIGSPAAGP